MQLVALALGLGFLAELAEIGPFEPARDLVWKLLMVVGLVYLATRGLLMLCNSGPFDSWLRTLHFAFSLPMNMARSAAARPDQRRQIGRLLAVFGSAVCGQFGEIAAAYPALDAATSAAMTERSVRKRPM